MYAARTVPAIVAKPPVITAWISDSVNLDKYGRMIKGAVAWPRNMFEAVETWLNIMKSF